MPHNLVRLSLRARDPTPCGDATSFWDAATGENDLGAVEAADAVEARWLRRLGVILDAPGENASDAARLLPYLWLGGRVAAEDVLYENGRAITDLCNVAEPWCATGPNSENVGYVGVEARDRRDFDILGDAAYGAIRRYVRAARRARPGAVFLVHCDRGINRSAAVAAAWLMDEEHMTLIEAARLLKDARRCVLGNAGFRLALVRHAAREGKLGAADDDDDAAKGAGP